MDGGTFNHMVQRDILFQGKAVESGKWIEGFYLKHNTVQICFTTDDPEPKHYIIQDGFCDWGLEPPVKMIEVHPGSIGQYTGMHEFVVSDKSFNAPLFEGDIVEVWSRRRPPHEPICLYRDKPTSQYDIEYKVRAVIVFKNGEWRLDYDNTYNHFLEQPRGTESSERTVASGPILYSYGFHGSNEEWYREHNTHYKWGNIVKIGNVFDSPELLNI